MRLNATNALTASLLIGAVLAAVASPAFGESGPRIPEAELLDIGIMVPDPGIRKKSFFLTGYEVLNPELRESEAAFIAVHLMRTLQATEQFGLVRMMPRNSVSADLFIDGRIRESSGRRLELELEVVDATGRRWIRRIYRKKATPVSYAFGYHADLEPFQEVYDEFAEDLIDTQSGMKKDYLEIVRQISELRFAMQLAPGIFGGYLTAGRRGRLELERLPARDDPMLARIRSIRTRDEFFLDLLAERYGAFYASMNRPYDDFRATRYDVELALRDAQSQASLANARSLFSPPDDFMEQQRAVRRVNFFRRQIAAQAEYLEEIAAAFATEVDPIKLELDGEVIRFEGTIEDQYRQWQALLEKIFETETGMSAKSRTFIDNRSAQR